MGLSGGPTGSRYVPPPPAQTGPRDVAAAIAALVEDRLARDTEIRTAVQRTGCDGLPLINRLDGTGCAPIGGQMVLVKGNWLLTKNVSRPMSGAGGNIAFASETILGNCYDIAADYESRLRFGDSVGNLWNGKGTWLSKGNDPVTLPTFVEWVWHPRETGGDPKLHVEGGTTIFTAPRWNVVVPAATHNGGGDRGGNADSLCFGGPNSDIILTCEASLYDEVNTCSSTALCVRRLPSLTLANKTDMQYANQTFNFMDGCPRFAVSGTKDGNWWIHLYGGTALSSPPTPWPNWEYVSDWTNGVLTSAKGVPGTGNLRIQRVTVDRVTMKPVLAETRHVWTHPDMEPWEDDTFLIAFIADEGA